MLFENLFDIVLGFLAAYYALAILALIVGIRRLHQSSFAGKPLVSVIVAARNEQANISGLLECLVHQDYPMYEIIIVNDRSTDRTAAIIGQFQQQDTRIRRIDITSTSQEMPSKKHALAQGIADSKGEILVFTDADCLPPAAWISAMVQGFEKNVGLVAGYSPYSKKQESTDHKRSPLSSLLLTFIQYEEFKGATWSAGSIGLNRGWLCTGRCLAYRRAVYDEVGGFEDIRHSVSGDDDLFLQMVRRKTSWQMRYVTSSQSHVPTSPPRTFRELVEQRTRHFSAGKYFSFPMKLFFFLFHLANLMILLALFGGIVLGPSDVSFLPYVIKCIMDSMLFFTAAPVFNEKRFGPLFLLMEILVVLYNSLIGPLGFLKRFEWKPEAQS
ncbi:MAG: glycosyltransferase [Ignavibacteriales bacterium]|nr:glycosyltransferase [Ignavibacteriales bacterium]